VPPAGDAITTSHSSCGLAFRLVRNDCNTRATCASAATTASQQGHREHALVQDRSMTYLECECACRRAEEEEVAQDEEKEGEEEEEASQRRASAALNEPPASRYSVMWGP